MKEKEQKIYDSKQGIPLECKRCGHKWTYHGHSDWYTSCGNCKATVNVRKKLMELGLLRL